jgi:hypothetical protein
VWYLKREGLLDVTPSDAPDDYLVLVMTGPAAPAAHSRDGVRPRCLTSIYLFDARQSDRRVGPSSAPDTAPAPRGTGTTPAGSTLTVEAGDNTIRVPGAAAEANKLRRYARNG